MQYEQAVEDIDLINRPRVPQFDLWSDWVNWDLKCDDDGWFIGWCPLHDREREGEGSAAFNFLKSSFRCMVGPESSAVCPRVALSIGRLTEALSKRYLQNG